MFARFVTISLALLATGFSAGDERKDGKKDDKDLLQGDWVLLVNGKESKGRLVVKGDTWTTPTGKQCTFKLDPSKSPKQLTLMVENLKFPGIYKIEGDTLTVCRRKMPAGERPKEFKGNPDAGIDLVVFKRAEKK